MRKKRLLFIISGLILLTLICICSTQIRQINGHWYFFNVPPRNEQVGWVEEGGQLHYYEKYGSMITNQQKQIGLNTYLFQADGTVFIGETTIDGARYYFAAPDGVRKAGWVERAGKRYYFDELGRKVTGRQRYVDGNIYLFEPSGAAFDGQIQMESAYYYFDAVLGMLHNAEKQIDEKWFFFGADGKRFLNGWFTLPDARRVYYDGDNGMLFGEQEIDGKSYFLNTSTGDMQTGTLYYLGFKYTIGEDGVITEKVHMQIWRGIDVSYFQGPNINWKAVADSGVQFAIIRAGWLEPEKKPVFKEDDYYVRNVLEAQKYGISVGSYVFVYNHNPEDLAQGLDEFHRYTTENRLDFDLPVFLDIEDGKYFKPNTDQLGGYEYRTNLIRSGLEHLSALGYKPGIYAYLKWANKEFAVQRLIDEGYPFWLARWYDNNAELDSATMAWNDAYPSVWQYRDTGKVPGIRGFVDMDYMYLDFMNLN
jgi:glucan-binding YG repeat protein/GH25 family lysozyme M1 (1,4-beta-N-acetylmuramidase)